MEDQKRKPRSPRNQDFAERGQEWNKNLKSF